MSIQPAQQLPAFGCVVRLAIPTFFRGSTLDESDANYFFGVAAVFVTYVGSLKELDIPESTLDILSDFEHRLSWGMLDRRQAAWSIGSISDNSNLLLLRRDANEVLQCLNIFGELTEVFDFETLVNVTDFINSEEVDKILD